VLPTAQISSAATTDMARRRLLVAVTVGVGMMFQACWHGGVGVGVMVGVAVGVVHGTSLYRNMSVRSSVPGPLLYFPTAHTSLDPEPGGTGDTL
jgi:hypothetical protein